MGAEESMHLFRNILMHPTGASEVPFMRRELYQMFINVGGLQKHCKTRSILGTEHPNSPSLLLCPTVVRETEMPVETLPAPSPWPTLEVTCRGAIPADGLLPLSD